MRNSADLRGCYPQRPKASVDNTPLICRILHIYSTQPHSITEQTLSYARALRLTAQVQNDVPRNFAFLTYQTYQNSNALFNL